MFSKMNISAFSCYVVEVHFSAILLKYLIPTVKPICYGLLCLGAYCFIYMMHFPQKFVPLSKLEKKMFAGLSEYGMLIK